MKFSLFKNAFSESPLQTVSLEEFLDDIKSGHWEKQITKLRSIKSRDQQFKKVKGALPAVTVSGIFNNRHKAVPLNKKLKKASGLICIDIDRKDNPKMRLKDIIDPQALAEFISCSGEGKKIIYRCDPVTTASEHRRVYDAVIKRLEDKGITIKVDPVVKSISSLQYVTWDPDLNHNPKTKLVIHPLPAPKIKKREYSGTELEQLHVYIDALDGKSITDEYEDWMLIMFGLSCTFGEAGREVLHKLAESYKNYSREENDEFYDACLERDFSTIEKPITVSTVFQLINSHLPKPVRKQLAKKYNAGHAVSTTSDGTEQSEEDLSGYVRHRLFLFKKLFAKENSALEELRPEKLNLNEFESLLKKLGFYRFGPKFVKITENIVETVDSADILRIVTEYVEKDGDYKFTYKGTEYLFPWEEIAHKWREIRANSNTHNQLAASLTHWEPNLLCDTVDASFIPYRNGVLKVTAKAMDLLPYAEMKQQIWRDRILPRNFTYFKEAGMYEQFFLNVTGSGKEDKEKRKSPNYLRAVWYYGYMLQGTKRMSTARALLLYDSKSGNMGRNGKTIIGLGLGKIRNMVTIDGKTLDLSNRFAFQTVEPWTDIVFIDDPSKFMSLTPLFNMITGNMNADRKNMLPVIKSVKFLIASNWILEASGTSEAGRQFVTTVNDFYVQWGKKNGDTITPIVDYHGKEFFTDWDEKDWAQFDSFSMRCLQAHLKDIAPTNTIIGNSQLLRFIQLHEAEIFFALAIGFSQSLKKGKDSLLCPQMSLIDVVMQYSPNLGQIKAGRVAREFLQAIGFKDISVTSMQVGTMTKMAYQSKVSLKDLDFGEYSSKLKFNL